MITRILNSRLPLMIFTPVKVFDISYFNAIHKAGALPVFDTEFLSHEDILSKALVLSRENLAFGLRLAAHDPGLISALKKENIANLDVISVPLEREDTPADLSRFGDTKILLEIRDIHLTEQIRSIDPHGLILKGNEAAGRVSRYSSFILMQWYLKNCGLPLFVHGGVGQYTAAGMLAAGVSGFVMDSQVLLADEAPVSQNFKKLLASVDEGDSTQIIFKEKVHYRVFAKLGTKIVKDLKEEAVIRSSEDGGQIYPAIAEKITALDDPSANFVQSLFYMGQDGLFAKALARKSTCLSDMIQAFFTTIGAHLDAVDRHDPVREHSDFAKAQDTRYPLIQGPMANVSDNAEFASKVLEAGALPFLAVGSLPEDLADTMIQSGADKVKHFGAGLVGIEAFNPQVNAHLDMVKKHGVPFALFAGGIPSQAVELEKAGTRTYLHTPSVSMMDNAYDGGCFRYIFEGGEAGGHVGSLTSMVLWEAAIDSLIKNNRDLSKLFLVFAGGITTSFSSLFISGMTAFLAARGAKIGLQVGTAYLFSRELVETEAVHKQYQDILIEMDETVVIGKTLGLASRTAPTPFARMMTDHEARMVKQKLPLKDRKRSFEKRNIGSLLIGSKGFMPDFKNPGQENYTWYKGKDHREKGNFLTGDSLAFFREPVDIKAIHDAYFTGKAELFRNLNRLEIFSSPANKIRDEIAVVGMGCTLPDADTPQELWENILKKHYAISPMPGSRMDRELYYDTNPKAEDKTYTDLAGHVTGFEFEAERFGYEGDKARRLSRSQQMVLQTAYKAVESAGLLDETDTMICEDPKRTAVIIATCLSNELGNDLQLKYWYPELVSMMEKTPAFQNLDDAQKAAAIEALRKGIEGDNPGYDPVHGILLNIEASRIAKHLGIRGTNYIVDAACASSMTAIEAGCGELLNGDHDQVIVGGVNTHLAPESFIGFAKMGTLSAKGSWPFDQRADGFVLGEGSAIFVLKRMKDAIRDNNKIFGVINGIGSSSDGKGKAIAAPNPKGQVLSLERCFEAARPGIRPEDVGFIEAHGTSTIVGDQAELGTLDTLYHNSGAGISSIKSQIGHLLGCAGAAGMLKALLAVDHGILPPNGQFESLSPKHDLANSSLFVVKDAQPWDPGEGKTRRAAVSSYGFGGINYHAVVEEMTPDYQPMARDIFTDTSYDFNDDRIVVAGMGVFLPGARNTDEFWDKLVSGEKQLDRIPKERFDNKVYAAQGQTSFYYLPEVKAGIVKDLKFNNLKYRMPPKMVKNVERGQIFGLEAASEALESSGIMDLDGAAQRTGVILGTIGGERQSKNIIRVRKNLIGRILENVTGLDSDRAKSLASDMVQSIRDTIPENNEDTTPGLLSNIISGRIANFFGLNGANYVLDASCASATMAMRNAIRHLQTKDMDFILAGGVDCNLYPAVLMAFKRLGLLSEGDCNFFDSRADGYVMGEGAAIHVVTTLKKAREAGMPVYGEINACTVRSSVPDHLLAPSEQTFVDVINEAYDLSAIRKSDINHLDLFAFSNIFGDMVEKQVTETCFSHQMHCGNIKPQFGYFKAANPAVAMAKLMLMNAKGKILPDHNYDQKHSTLNDCKSLKPAFELVDREPGQPLRFAANVNGIGGNHSHLVMGCLPRVLETRPVQEARSSVAAQEASSAQAGQRPDGIAAMAAAPAAASNVPGQDIVLPDAAHSADPKGKKLRMVALLSGQGAQRPGMMKALYDFDDEIRKILDRGEAIFKTYRGYSLLDLMFGEDDALNATQNTQPAVFLSSAALCSRLALEGFSPDYFIGHSVGEYTALFCSGILGFDDAMGLIIKRSDLMYQSTLKNPGKIMVVFKNEKQTQALIRRSFVSNIWVTNKNSEKQTAVSGRAEDIEAFCQFLSQEGTMFKKLNLTGAFHTPMLEEASQELRAYLDTLTFNRGIRYSRVISNTLAAPYPEDETQVKDLLARQIISPVEFIKSIESVYVSGRTHFIEIGPSRLLVNLLKHINIGEFGTAVSVDARKGEPQSFETCRQYLMDCNSLFEPRTAEAPSAGTGGPSAGAAPVTSDPGEPESPQVRPDMSQDFEFFKQNNKTEIDHILYQEFLRRKKEAAVDAMERFEFNTDGIVVSGVSVGLPGKARQVFAKDNFDAILNGKNFIESLDTEAMDLFADKNITKLYKQPDGNARFVQITKTEDVIHLAGQLGYFDLTDEYGIKQQYDIAMGLGIAAGIEALKDANIPLVMQYKKMKDGRAMIPDGFALPQELQEETGVIITSLWPNGETLISELEKYFYEKLFLKPYEEFEKIYYYLMEKISDVSIKDEITDWFFKAKARKRTDMTSYKFDRNFLLNACPLGSAHLAQIIKAKGPNTLVSSACASTTLAMGIAEDWIRVGRCKRVLVVGGENATSSNQGQWIGSGFLALGAATIKKRVSEAAKPFDEDRNGTILGAGAVGLVIEGKASAARRGMNGQAEILGTHIANSAYHAYNIDVPHMSREMNKFISKVERQTGLKKENYADKLLFMSHETYTPARGGSADAEVQALESTFAGHLNKICISNTKGFTGHTLGAAVEDVVLVKALQKRKAPPIANLSKIPKAFRKLNFSGQGAIDAEYGLHLSAGFGSHFAFVFIRRVEENPVKGNLVYQKWLRRISGSQNPEMKVIDNTLCVVAGGQDVLDQPKPAPAKAPATAPAAEPAIQPAASPAVPAAAPAAQVLEPAARPVARVKAIIADQTGYAQDMLEDDLDLEADLGIDTVKQVEIFGRIASDFDFTVPDDLKLRDLNTIARLGAYIADKTGRADEPAAAPEPASEPAQATATAANDIKATVQKIIADQTGYAQDMLEDDLDLEADLGIDTVKQVEIFGKVSSKFGFPVPDDLKLRDLNTIARLSGYIREQTGTAADAAQADPAPAGTSALDTGSSALAAPVAAMAPEQTDQDVTGAVKEVIAKQTGYSEDMLEEDLDLEADLGIDTVKQVEIFGKIAAKFGFPVPEDLTLGDLNTIAKLAGYIRQQTAAVPPAEAASIPATGSGASAAAAVGKGFVPDVTSPIKRLVVRGHEAPMPGKPVIDLRGKTLLVSLDSHGFADAVIRQIKTAGGRVKTLAQAGTQKTKGKPADLTLDLRDPEGLESAMKGVKPTLSSLNGFIHLAPLDAYFERGRAGQAADPELAVAVKSAFVLIRHLFEDLDREGSVIGTLTFDSVVFPYMEGYGRIHPLFAGLGGLMKTVNKEMPDTRVKVVDFSYKQPKKSIKGIAERFMAELLGEDPRVEAGFANKKRYVLSMHPVAADDTGQVVEAKDTLLVTGGAGGITFEILKQVVQTYGTDLVILGRSDIYATDPAYLDSEADQPQLMARLRQDMPGAKPIEIKQALDRVMRVRQTVANVDALTAMGVSVDYFCTDVTDFDAVKRAVDACDRIDGILHAAGIEMSQFIPKKELGAFEQVVDVKVKGMQNLLRATADRDYQYCLAFSSVTARFGNEGQVDYTAANDCLGKVLFLEKQIHPDRVYKVFSWTAWDGAGMATNATVKKVLENRGVCFLPLDQGVRFFMADLLDDTESETVFSGLDYDFDVDGLLGGPSDTAYPFLDDLMDRTDKSLKYTRTLDLDRDLFLKDHTMGDVPLFLGSTGVETMAEVARVQSDDRPCFTGMTDFHIPYGIKLLKGRPKELVISGSCLGKGQFACEIASVFKNPAGVVMGEPKTHYQGTLCFDAKPLAPRTIDLPEFTKVSWEGDLASLIYHPRRLFMFGLFNTITDVNTFDGTTLVTTLRDDSDAEFFKGVADPQFVAAPVLVDAMFQTGGLLEFFTTSRTVLPFRIRSMFFYRTPEKKTAYYCVTKKTAAGKETNIYDICLCDDTGSLLIDIQGFEMVKLNRLEAEDCIAHKVQFTADPSVKPVNTGA